MDPSVNDADRAAFEAGVVAAYPRLLSFALGLCRNQADAHDLVQDTVERGLRCWALFREGDSPDRWMLTILRRLFVDGYRSRRRRRLVQLEERRDHAVAPAPPEEPSPWETLSTEDVREALSHVGPAYRETFSLFALDNLAQTEIARRLSISQYTVATRVFRARDRLREILATGVYRLPQSEGRSRTKLKSARTRELVAPTSVAVRERSARAATRAQWAAKKTTLPSGSRTMISRAP
jgi:RNA polymerase sigma-70 factor (ECF subfamily)